MRKDLVTCVMPTYARPLFAKRAVEQFLQQSWTKAELLVIDDSPSKLRAKLPSSPRVKVIYLSERQTLGDKHNKGLDLAQGDFIAHWDDDDWQSPRRLLKQIEVLLLGNEGDICGYATDMLLTTGDAKFWRFDRSYMPRRQFVGNSMTDKGVPFMDGTAMFRRSVVGNTRYPTIQVSQKVKFLYDLKLRGARLVRMPNDGMYVYVRHGEGSSATNTWQYLNDRRLMPVERPNWFPESDLEFYRKAV